MATKRAGAMRVAPPAPEPSPSGEEVARAIDEWQAANGVLRGARELEEGARRHLVDLLHRAGLRGFSL